MNKERRIVLVLVIFAFILISGAVYAKVIRVKDLNLIGNLNSGNNLVFIKPNFTSVTINENFVVSVDANVDDNIYALEFKLFFDKNILQVSSVKEENFLKQDNVSTFSIIKVNNTQGRIEFASTRYGTQTGVNGTGSLVLINFSAFEIGISNLNLENVALINNNLNIVDVTIRNGSVEVREIACFNDGDCGIPDWKDISFCSNDNIWDYWITPKCGNPGQVNAYCYDQEQAKLKQDCGEDEYSANYCYDNDVYKDFTDRGCSEVCIGVIGECPVCFENTVKEKVAECGGVGCENGNCRTGIWLLSPENENVFSRINPRNFVWGASPEYSQFKVEYSQYRDFSRKKSFPSVRYLHNYNPTESRWRNLRREANRDSDGKLYWRVYGSGSIRSYSNVFEFSLEPPTPPALIIPENNELVELGELFDWDLGTYTKAKIQVSTSSGFPGTSQTTYLTGYINIPISSYILTSNSLNRLKSLANRYYTNTLYWRVYVRDDEGLMSSSDYRSIRV